MCNFSVPGGAIGVALKSNFPNICAYTYNLGFVLDVINQLIVIFDCFSIQHHKYIGKLLSTDAKPATKLSLKVRIARSAAFILWLFGGANCTTVFIFVN